MRGRSSGLAQCGSDCLLAARPQEEVRECGGSFRFDLCINIPVFF